MSTRPRTLISDLVVGESPRWHADRLWFANWGLAQEIVAADPDGKTEVVARGPKFAGYCLDWLPDGTMLVTGEHDLLRLESDGSYRTHAPLSEVGSGPNDLVVDGRGNTYVGLIGFAFGEQQFRPGTIALVTPAGAVRLVAEDIWFPNGMVVTPDNATLIVAESWANRLTAFDIGPDGELSGRRVWAQLGGDGICLDASGAIWTSGVSENTPFVQRVREGGEVLDRFEVDGACFACMLGGAAGTTLFLMVADWLGEDRMGEMFTAHTGRVLTTEVDIPHAGRP
ncbi:SMP-30/gluconolactonase/LRE family protein [Nocardia transvalensis]|uniref:SMP-30/gluconolactonase/LRE family protein n=1 Tax=Nocardia transvalensis TaxID=37333 RepID=UPI00189447C8|nr:SMP-30/gluconolactonase/LRE family protein [Nocardia transvalensis]MBF6328372.1 SMP-30/gluconolactonase/LRE family protein [Nocardia transvalensis]